MRVLSGELRAWRRDFSWIVLSMMLPSSSNGLRKQLQHSGSRQEGFAPRYRYSALRTSSLSFIPNAHARAWAISIPMLTFPSSMELMYVR